VLQPDEDDVTAALSRVRARGLAAEMAAQSPPAEAAALIEKVVATGALIPTSRRHSGRR
jgi:hypothetical protein